MERYQTTRFFSAVSKCSLPDCPDHMSGPPLLESNSPRNNQLETHPDDERGRWPQGRRLHRMDRFPDAWENSYRKTPRRKLFRPAMANQWSRPASVELINLGLLPYGSELRIIEPRREGNKS